MGDCTAILPVHLLKGVCEYTLQQYTEVFILSTCVEEGERSGPLVERSGPPVERSGPPVERSGPPVERSGPPVERSGPPVERPGPPAVSLCTSCEPNILGL